MSIAGAIGSIISSGIGAATSASQNKKNREFQSEMLGKEQDFAREQREWQLETEKALTADERAYNEEMYNKYQSPDAYVRQLKDAGLNPSLAYGGNSAGSPEIADYGNIQAGSSPSASPLPSFDMSHHFSDISKNLVALSSQAIQNKLAENDSERVDFQRMSAQAQALKYLSERDLIDKETYGRELENIFAESTLGKRIEQVNLSVDEAKSRISEIRQSVVESLSRTHLNEATISKVDKDISLIEQNIKNLGLVAHQIEAETIRTVRESDNLIFARDKIVSESLYNDARASLAEVERQCKEIEKSLLSAGVKKAEVEAILAPLDGLTRSIGNVFSFGVHFGQSKTTVKNRYKYE